MVLQSILFCWPSDKRISSQFSSGRQIIGKKRDLPVLPEDLTVEDLAVEDIDMMMMGSDEATVSHDSSSSMSHHDEGALTPAVSNCYSKRTAATVEEIPHSPLSSTSVMEGSEDEQEEEEELGRFTDNEDESTLGDSWEPLQPDMDELMEEEEEETLRAPAFVSAMMAPSVHSSCSSEEGVSTPVPVFYHKSSSSSSGTYSPPPIIYKAAPAVHDKYQEPPPVYYKSDKSMAWPKMFMVITLLALLVGILSAFGAWEKLDLLQQHKQKLDQQLVQVKVQQLKQKMNAFPIPMVYRPVDYQNSTEAMARNATQALPAPPAEDTSKYVWLSPDDDVWMGQVFWGASEFAFKRTTTRKEVRQEIRPSRPLQQTASDQANDWSEEPKNDENTKQLTTPLDLSSITDDRPYWTEKLEIIHNIVHLYTANQTVNQQRKLQRQQQRQQKNIPIKWVSKQYQRLNIYVLGQSQLAQLKRMQHSFGWLQ